MRLSATARSALVSCLICCAGLALAQTTGPTTTASPPAVPAGALILSKTLPFKLNEPLRLDLVVGSLRVPDLRITREEGNFIDDLLPPRGGQSRFSYLRYAFLAENPSDQGWTLAARVRLLDRNGAVIDEFEFRRTVGSGKARPVDLKRLSLNYAVALIDKIEVTLSAER